MRERDRPLVRDLGAGPEETLVCGMAFGYADEAAPVNTLHTPREAVDTFGHWVGSETVSPSRNEHSG